MIIGRVTGLVLGLVVGRLPGALVGFGIGYWFDWQYGEQLKGSGGFGRFFSEQEPNQQQATFFYVLFSVLGHIAKAKGRVTPADITEAQRLMNTLGLQKEQLQEAQNAFRQGKDRDFPLTEVVRQFRRDHHNRQDLMRAFLEQIIESAVASKSIEEESYKVLSQVAKALGFTRFELDKLLVMHAANQRFESFREQRPGARGATHKQQEQAAYDVLGVKPPISANELKQVYRKLMREHHPDKLAAQGLPEEMRALATRRAQDIQAAYELLKRN